MSDEAIDPLLRRRRTLSAGELLALIAALALAAFTVASLLDAWYRQLGPVDRATLGAPPALFAAGWQRHGKLPFTARPA